MINKAILPLFSLLFANTVFAQHTNILISSDNLPNEPTICIDPLNTNRIIAGSNIDNSYFSVDGGQTWTWSLIEDTFNGVWGDPVTVCDKYGDFYFFHLSNPPTGTWVDRIVCQKSTNGGISYGPGTSVGKNGPKVQDKHWISIDRTNNHMYVTWTEFDVYNSNAPQDSSRILFSKSLDAGQTWATPKRISKISGDCVDSDNTVEGAVPAVGPNGQIYVAWAGPAGLVFDRSIDGGENWLQEDIKIADLGFGWDYIIPGIYRTNGLPITLCDTANSSPYKGTIYVNWSAQYADENDTDIWLAKSTDGGMTWSDKIRVNNDVPGRHQFFTWAAIDQSNGNLYFVFYDRRNYNDTRTDVYMARSTDGGTTFENFKISESPFTPTQSVFFGDYNNLSVHNGVVRPIWTRLQNGQLSVWTALVNTSLLGNYKQENETKTESKQYPNPFKDEIYFSFKIHEKSKVSIKISDMNGKLICMPIENKTYEYGKYIEKFSASKLNLATGNYNYQIIINGKETTGKMLKVSED